MNWVWKPKSLGPELDKSIFYDDLVCLKVEIYLKSEICLKVEICLKSEICLKVEIYLPTGPHAYKK